MKIITEEAYSLLISLWKRTNTLFYAENIMQISEISKNVTPLCEMFVSAVKEAT